MKENENLEELEEVLDTQETELQEELEIEETSEIQDVEVEQEETEEELDEEYDEETEYDEEIIYERKKPLSKLVFLVAFTAIMLVSSTYAWFTAQKNVTISNLEGKVNVAEGLMISLDAKNWSQQVDFDDPILDSGCTLDVPYLGSADGTSYVAGSNNRPTELVPVSTTGVADIGANEEISFYTGININKSEVYGIQKTKAHVSESTNGANDLQYAGFYAIDLYLQNSSKIGTGETQGEATETLQLNTNSLLSLLTAGTAENTGLQNTARVALAMYSTEGLNNSEDTVETEDSNIYVTASQSQILKAYEGQKISDIAIWEPNASTHVNHIVINNNTLKLTSAVDNLYTTSTANAANSNISTFTATEVVPTYGMTSLSLNAVQQLQDYNATTNTHLKGIKDIYNWNITDTNTDGVDDATGLSRQIALQTDTEADYTIAEGGVRNLVSVTSPGAYVYEMGDEDDVVTFEMLKNSIIKLRMYVWLEGQDVDCTNFASHGGGVQVELGLMKGATVGSAGAATGGGTTSSGTYLPTGFREVAAATATNGLTIADGAGNEYVWVEVPQTTTVYPTAGLSLDLDNLTGTDLTNAYTAIENDLHTYTTDYRNVTSYRDIHSGNDESTGLTSTQYTELKNKMLKSVYENGGFYVGKYEAGIKDSYRDYRDDYETEHPITETAVVQANAYPYNYIRCSQAQAKASSMASGEYTSSLMFGVQWDLMLKYLETKGVSQSLLNDDSTSWGNYYNSTYSIENESVKYNIVDEDTWLLTEWLPATTYKKESEGATLLSTGANSSFSKMGIYDIAGNVYEWTLEYTSNSDVPCALRGGDYSYDGDNDPASIRDYNDTTFSYDIIGFRVSLF